MKKTVVHFLSIFVLCIAMLLPFETVYAADITISASKSSVSIGDSVTVTVTVPENVSGTMNVIYPTDLLEYSKASAEVNANKAGTIAISIGKNGLTTSNKLTITFKAKTAGDATIKANGIDFFDNESYDAVALGDSSTKVTIKNESQEAELSSDYYLAKLNITAGSKKVALSPTFNYRKTNYTATVDYDVTDVVVSVTRSSGKAEIVSMTDNGKVKLDVGANVIEITVKAENGKTLTYKITITRKEKPADNPEPDPGETENPGQTEDPEPATPDFEQAGTSLYVKETPDDKIPENFVEKPLILAGGKEVLGLSFEKADLTVLYLENDNKVGNLYIYDATNESIYPFVKLSAEESYVIVVMPDDTNVPQGYQACTLSIEGKGIVNAYQYQATRDVDPSDFYLIYCVNNKGNMGWYQYDSYEGTYQRYVGIVPSVSVDPDPEVPSESESESQQGATVGGNVPSTGNNSNNQPTKPFVISEGLRDIIVIVAIVVCVLIIIAIVSIFFTKRRNDDDDDDDDDFDEEEIFKRPKEVKAAKTVKEASTEDAILVNQNGFVIPEVQLEEEIPQQVEKTPEDEVEVEFYHMEKDEEELEFIDL